MPDGDAVGDEPVDPAVEAEQRKLAQLNDLGVDLLSISISSPAELEGASLRTPGAGGAPFLATVTAKLLIGLRDADYVLVFDPGRTEPLVPNLRGTEGAPLIAIQRIDRAVPTCTTWVSTAAQPGEDLIGYGRRIGTATDGICGGIAAMHSFLQLGAVRREDVVDGANFKEGPLRVVQGSNRKQMTPARLRKLHEAVGATTCQMPGGAGFATNNRGALERFNSELNGFLNDPNNTWDCTLFVRTRRDGKDVLAHFEHVVSVSTSGGKTSIGTANGFDQGNQTDQVPVNPGQNTWTSEPGSNPPFSLTGSTGANGGDLVRGTPNVGLVNYLCCRRP
ncbi:MAG: hypothetical protein ACT4QB_16050 [Gammaproteobacteria bacterium]